MNSSEPSDDSESSPRPDEIKDAHSPQVASQITPIPKTTAFWMSLLSLMIATFLAALDTSAVATALPTIINHFNGKEFVWLGTAYSLAGTAFVPMSGHLANVFGRRPVVLGFLLIFALGSALCGAAQSMNMLIVGRSVQGIGSGGILSLTEIILADLVPLRERGGYQGMIGVVWAIASILGPIVGGAFAQRESFSWRGLFYLNLPLTAISFALCVFFLDLKTPRSSLKEKLFQIDWIGNIIIIGSSSSFLLGLTWAGVKYPWDSPRVLVPIIVGVVGMALFLAYEARIPTQPTMPLRLLSNRTSLSGYIGTALHGLIISAVLFYLPVYFQACKNATPLQSGIDMLPYSFSIAPFAIVAGGTATALNQYKPQNIIAWGLIILGMGLQSSLHENSAPRNWAGFQVVGGIGFGLLFTATTYPILASLRVSDNASALSTFVFVRSFFQAWGVTIGATVLENQLKKNLPLDFLSKLSDGIEIAYAAIPQIPLLPQPLRDEVRQSFADSLRVIWQVMIAVAGLGLMSSLIMKALPLQEVTDDSWGLQEGDEKKHAGEVLADDTRV